MKKKMYYNMRIKTLKRNTSNVIRKGMEARLFWLGVRVRVRVRIRVRVTFPRLQSLTLIPTQALAPNPSQARQAKASQVNLNLNVLIRQQKDGEREVHERDAAGNPAGTKA